MMDEGDIGGTDEFRLKSYKERDLRGVLGA